MFIIHKKQTFYSMRRNGVISSSLDTSETRMGHAKETKTGMYKVTHCIGLLHSCTLVIILNVGLTAVHNGYSNRS